MFIIYTIEIYACLTIYLLSNIAILVEKTMIGTHMRIKFGFFFTDGAWTSQSRPTVHELALFWPLLKCSYVLLLIWLNLYKNLIFYRENMKDNLWQFIYKKIPF